MSESKRFSWDDYEGMTEYLLDYMVRNWEAQGSVNPAELARLLAKKLNNYAADYNKSRA